MDISVGNISESVQKLLDVTEKSLYLGLEQVKPGERLSNISHAVQTHAEENGFSSLGSMLVTESGKTYMRTLKSRTMVHPIEALD